MVQNSSNIVAALNSAEEALTISGMSSVLPPAKLTATRAIIIHMGLPGGCPTSSLNACDMYSGQSQKLAVGSNVSR